MRIRLVSARQPDPSASTPLLALCLPAINAIAPVILSKVDAALAERETLQAARQKVQIILGEVLNNIVEHAYRTDPLGGVGVVVRTQPDAIELVLSDWGLPFSKLCLPVGDPPEPSDLAEGGYGWFLIRSLAQKIDYARQDGRNSLCILIALSVD